MTRSKGIFFHAFHWVCAQVLTSLEAAGNQLTSLPEEVGELKALQKLAAFGNRLARLPNAIGGLEALQELWLQGNRLTELPASIGALQAGLPPCSVRGMPEWHHASKAQRCCANSHLQMSIWLPALPPSYAADIASTAVRQTGHVCIPTQLLAFWVCFMMQQFACAIGS